MAKISGIHVNDWRDGIVEYVRDSRPGWVKTLAPDRAKVERCKEVSPKTQFIGRMYRSISDQKAYVSRMESGAEWYFRDLQSQGTWPVIEYWEGVNEWGQHPTADFYRFQVRLGQLLRNAGKKYLSEGCSVGTWSGYEDPMQDWKSSWTHEAIRNAEGIHTHEYCAPRMNSEFIHHPDIKEEDGGYYTLRYRKAWSVLPTDCRKGWWITECGIDSGIWVDWAVPGQGGWRSFCSPEEYVEQLKWYLGCCKSDGYVKAVIPFCLYARDPTWDSYEMWEGSVRDLWGEVMYSEDEGEGPPEPGEDWETRALVAEDKLRRIEGIVQE